LETQTLKTADDKTNRKNRLVYAIVFFTFIDLFTQLPVMSTYASSLGAGASVAGFAVGMYSLSNMFGNVLSGKMTDRFGAYAVICAGLFATGAALLSYQAVGGVGGLLTVRFFHGFLSGLIAPAAFTYLANRTQKERQGSRSAITGSFVGIAAIVGPAYSGIMASRTSVPFVFATIAALGFILFLIALRALRTGSEKVRREKKESGALRFNRGMLQAFIAAFFLMFSQGALAFLLPLHVEALGYSSRLSGTLMSMFGLVAVAIFLLPTNRMFDRRSPASLAAIGLGIIGLCQILIGQIGGIIALYGVLALYGFGFALLFPAMNTLLIHATNENTRGRAYGLFYALFSIGTVAGSSGIGLVPLALELRFAATGIALIGCAAVIQAVKTR